MKRTNVARVEKPVDHAFRDLVRARVIDLIAADKDETIIEAEHGSFQPGGD